MNRALTRMRARQRRHDFEAARNDAVRIRVRRGECPAAIGADLALSPWSVTRVAMLGGRSA